MQIDKMVEGNENKKSVRHLNVKWALMLTLCILVRP